MRTVFAIAAVFALAAAPAFATTVNTPWNPLNPNDELNLYEIYNAIYGTSLTNAQVQALQVSPDEIFGAPAYPFGFDAQFRARYANDAQVFGYVANADPSGSPGPLINVLTAPGNGLTGPGAWTHVVPGSTSELPIAFFDDSTHDLVFSVAAWNPDGKDHMVMLQGTDGTFLLAFEDRSHAGSDFDYNDLVIQVQIRGSNDPIAEPTSLLLISLGVAGLMLRKRIAA